jgi:hypothetical protein
VQEALTRRLSWLTLVARCECLKRHGVSNGVGERESEVRADFGSLVRWATLTPAPTPGRDARQDLTYKSTLSF